MRRVSFMCCGPGSARYLLAIETAYATSPLVPSMMYNRSEWPPDTKNYLRRAGTQMGFRAVLRCMFEAAKEEDENAGNGECQLIFRKEWSRLPTCRNDHEFEVVARVCGYGGDDFISLPCW
jgi:hypothetical protein